MIIDHQASQASDRSELPSANDLSRRSFLRAGAAAGGGVMLSLSLPLATGAAEAGVDATFTSNASCISEVTARSF